MVIKLKRAYVENHEISGSAYEILPQVYFNIDGINDIPVLLLNEFASHNPIFKSRAEIDIHDFRCKVYFCEVIEFWLSSKKYDACYQPFYPTWLMSSLIICLKAKLLGFSEIIDIGSGDARIPYCGSILGLRSISIELDANLINLQRNLINLTGVNFEILNCDACMANFAGMNLLKPMFLISGLPEHGEVLAKAVMSNLINNEILSSRFGLALMGSHTMKQYSRDRSLYGWGHFVSEYKLRVLDSITLPTMWTNDQFDNTPFIFTIPY